MSDFTGLATVYDVMCTDGRLIKQGAFDRQDGEIVPLVWRHGHGDMRNILGHGVLRKSEAPPGMRIEATFNNTKEAHRARQLVENGDVTHLSIWANEVGESVINHKLNQREVFEGTIREVSLVLAGANPGARIDDVVRHSDDPFEPDFVVLDGIIIHTEIPIEFDEEDVIEEVDEVEVDDVEDAFLEMDLDDLDLEDLDQDIVDILVNTEVFDDEDGEEFGHFGVKGMKWGVRRTAEQLGSGANVVVRTAAAKYAARVSRMYEKDAASFDKAAADIRSQKTYDQTFRSSIMRKQKAALEDGAVGLDSFAKTQKNKSLAEAAKRDADEHRAVAKKIDAKLKEREADWKAHYEKDAKFFDEMAADFRSTGKKWQQRAESNQAKANESKKKMKQSEYPTDDDIIHFGVKGMKWGVRRTAEQLGKKASDGAESRRQKIAAAFTARAEEQEGHAASIAAAAAKVKASNKVEDQFKLVDTVYKSRKALKDAADDLEEAGNLHEDKGQANHLKLSAKIARDISKNGFEYDLNGTEEYGPKGEIIAKIFADAAAYNRTGAKEFSSYGEKKKVKQSEYPTVDDIIHAVDDSLVDILGTLSGEQEQFFNIVMQSAVTGEKPTPTDKAGDEDGPTLEDVFNTLSEEQKNVLYYLAGELSQDQEENLSQENVMTTNIFENTTQSADKVLSHEQIRATLASAVSTRANSLREVFNKSDITLSHSITDIDFLFPEARNVDSGGPQFYSRPMEWVEKVLGGTRTRPFSRIKSQYADLTPDAARARGYVTGDQKAEEVIAVLKRVTTPQTIYKLQSLDRDDILDITDFDVVVWLKEEMRMMLREELARAVLLGDGRDPGDDYKIQETNVRPIVKDDAVYTIQHTYNDVGNLKAFSALTDEELLDLIDFIAEARTEYRGSGSPTFYCQPTVLTRMMLVRDADGRRIHASEMALADALRVSKIVEIPPMADAASDDVVNPTGLPAGTYDLAHLGVIVNLSDYVIGMDRGGQTSFFDDFDIDYNKYKYLYETRLSGALVNPKSAIAVNLVTAKTA